MRVGKRYKIIEKVGEGGVGIVYQARDILSGQIVALKHFKVADHNSVKNNDDYRTSFINEFRILSSLRHPNIISVFDYGLHEGDPYIVTELLKPASSFDEAVVNLSVNKKIQFLNQILDALNYLHRRGIIHRDLKPSNILVKNNRVKLLDFGLSVVADIVYGRDGTLGYMAPETLKSGEASPQSDLYSFGVIAYEVFAGNMPFHIHDIDGMIREMPDMSMLEELNCATVINRLLLKNPDDRYSTAIATKRAFCDVMNVVFEESVPVRESFLQASRFIAREQEFAQLKEAWQLTLQGNINFTLIAGESGIGKTRLLDELKVLATVSGILVVIGKGHENAVSYELWRPIIRQLLLEVSISDSEARVLKTIVPNISKILGNAVSDPVELPDTQQQERLVYTIVDVIKRVGRPLLILLEDIHWANDSLLPLQQLVLMKDQLQSLMIVSSYRVDEKFDAHQVLDGFNQIYLSRLNRQQITIMTENILGDEYSSKDLIDLMEKETEGNTLFIIEALRTLANNAGRLDDIKLNELPDNIFTNGMRAILQRRFADLNEDDMLIVTYAAVAGRKIDIQLLSYLLPSKDIENWLYSLEAHTILTVQDNEWLFAHDKLRQAVLEDLSQDTLAYYHCEIALAIENLYSGQSEYTEILYNHWHSGNNTDKELHYLEAFIKHLMNTVMDFDFVQSLITRGLNLLSAEDARLIPLLNLRAKLYWIRGLYDDALHNATKAEILADRLAHQEYLAMTLHSLGEIARLQGDFDLAMDYLQRCLVYRERLNDFIEIGTTLCYLGALAGTKGDFAEADIYFENSLTIAEEIDDHTGIGNALNCLGYNAVHQENYESAVKYLERSLEIRRELHDKTGMVNTMFNLGWTFTHFEGGRAKTIFKEIMKIGLSMQTMPIILECLIGFSKLHIEENDLRTAANIIRVVKEHPSYNHEIKILTDQLQPEVEVIYTEIMKEPSIDFNTLLANYS